MARTLINETLISDASANTAAAGVYQTGDNTNGMYLNTSAAVAKRKAGTLVLHFKCTNAAPQTVTVRAGSGKDVGPAWRAPLGDLAISIAATSGEQMVRLNDEARYKQADGTINIDFSGTGITVAAFRLGLSN